jgi:hypothetical protein
MTVAWWVMMRHDAGTHTSQTKKNFASESPVFSGVSAMRPKKVLDKGVAISYLCRRRQRR